MENSDIELEDNVEAESEVDVERDQILDMIDNISNKNYTRASDTFHDLLNAKIRDSLEARKIAVATQIFTDNAEETEENLEEYLEDETV
jgi:hypothetical protein